MGMLHQPRDPLGGPPLRLEDMGDRMMDPGDARIQGIGGECSIERRVCCTGFFQCEGQHPEGERIGWIRPTQKQRMSEHGVDVASSDRPPSLSQ